MPLDPRAVATHGLGFDELLVAVQGLLPFEAQEQQVPPPDPFGIFRPRRRVRRVYPLPAVELPDDDADDEAIALWMLRMR